MSSVEESLFVSLRSPKLNTTPCNPDWASHRKCARGGGATTPAVYFAFFEAATWTRTVKDRFEGRLKSAVQPQDCELWNALQRIRSQSVGRVFEDARSLAGTSLHWYSPPHAGFGAKIVEGKLIYPIIDSVVDHQDFRNNIRLAVSSSKCNG